jgi:hypothetical protein
MNMHNLFSTWTGLFKYKNTQMPLLHLTATFAAAGENRFKGFISETPLILPDVFDTADIIIKPTPMTAWGSIACDIIEGELLNKDLGKWGKRLDFVKSPDQLSGYPVFCWGGFNSATGLIVGAWHVVEGDTPCPLPLNLKSGNFTFSKIEDGRKDVHRVSAPLEPELLLV